MLKQLLDNFKTSLAFDTIPIICDFLEDRGKNVAHLRSYKLDANGLTSVLYSKRSNRNSHPDGEFDKKRRFYPSDNEDPNNTIRNNIRSPSTSYPFSYMTACRTRKHCKELVDYYIKYGTGPSDLMSLIRSKADIIAQTFEAL